jgi:hypothetical protein
LCVRDVRELQPRRAITNRDQHVCNAVFAQLRQLFATTEHRLAARLSIDIVQETHDVVRCDEPHDVGHDERVSGRAPDCYFRAHASAWRRE